MRRKISRLKNSKQHSHKGFTLIEIMIVLAILGFGLTLGVSRFSNRSGELRAVLRKSTVLSRELHTRAKLNGVTYRLVVDLGDGGPKSKQMMYVEKGTGATVIKDRDLDEEEDDDEENPRPKDFQRDSHILKNPIQIPRGVYISEVEINRIEKPFSQGVAYIHYLPQGLVEEAAIHFKGTTGDQKWTISIHPLTGRAEVLSPSMRLQELQNQ